MTPERRKLRRAELIQRIRSVERMQSVAAASEAEATRARLFGVAERTRSLAAHYAQREGDIVGADLRSGKAMGDQLQRLTELSEKQAEEAELQSQAKREVLAQSDMRLRKAKESRRDLVRQIVASLEKG
ncbi:hypothetical protein BA950_10305 [Erythrobacter sp. SAORIC-644]|nr:hypothetical protein [Qipengyuania aerophila]MAQ66151.1 hypothetical protein [Sphingomonadaceae bacterium]PHR05006.1 MAG: hypothetical protein COB31_02735 [Erythrobacter sp.]PNQ76180.1 hypothetical protein BA950_10305 [Erythrobacter sp. SAORIC-644]MBX7487114.1 hypothetical protein [Qipengyuania aerophila]HAD15707.1 hypothetical protein [Erythrobacter sp.]